MNERIEYAVCVIDEFAKRFHLTPRQAFNYVDSCGGIDFLDRNYGIAHTLPMSEIVDDVFGFCQRSNGDVQRAAR